MPKILLLVAMGLLSACATVQQTSRVNSTINAMEFNSVASRYMPRPTTVDFETLRDGTTILTVRMDPYGSMSSMPEGATIRFSRQQIHGYVEAIDKYLSWTGLATSRNDQLTKEIAKIPTWPNGGLLKFTFHSGNENHHYLAICFATSLASLDQFSTYFDTQNARRLRQLLLDFESGALAKTDDSVYR